MKHHDWIEEEYENYLAEAAFCICTESHDECDCDHMTFKQFEDAEFRRLEDYWGQIAYEELEDQIECLI